MSSIIRFFIAPDDAAAAGMPRSGPACDLETVELGNFDPMGMLNDWEAAFLARGADEIAEVGRPESTVARGSFRGWRRHSHRSVP